MVRLQTLDLAIGVRVPVSQMNRTSKLRAAPKMSRPFCAPIAGPPLKRVLAHDSSSCYVTHGISRSEVNSRGVVL